MGLNSSVTAVFFVSLLALGASARADSIVFDVNLGVGSGSVAGTITTDGNLGTLTESDILGVDLTINGPFGSAASTNTPGDIYRFVGTDLSETASDLIFNFSGASGGGFTLLSDDRTQAWSTGEASYLQPICGNANCDPNGMPEVEVDSRRAPVSYTELTGDVVIGAAAPEPGTLFLLCIGFIGLGAVVTIRGSVTP